MSSTKSNNLFIALLSGTCSIASFICAILIIYFGYHFYKGRNSMIIQKRYPYIVFIINILGLPMYLIAYQRVFLPFIVSRTINDYDIIWCVIYPYCAYGGTLFTTIRFYLIYFDIHFLNASKNLQWKSYITTDRKTLAKDNWYIQHRNTLGNSRRMTKVCLIAVSILGTTQMILKLLENNITNGTNSIYATAALFMDFCFYVIPVVITIVIWYKTPSFEDTIYIHQEMRVIAILYFCCLILYISCGVTGIFVVESDILTLLFTKLFTGVVGIIGTIATTFPTVYVVSQFTLRHHASLPEMDIDSLSRTDSIKGYEGIKLPKVLNNRPLYELFMQHLMKELCMENLLGFTEFIQYQNMAYKAFDLDYMDETFQLESVDNFIEHTPKSNIVYTPLDEKTKVNEFKMKAYLLYCKYVVPGCEFEINISYKERTKLMKQMSDQSYWMNQNTAISTEDLSNLFSESCHQIHLLMMDAFNRFREIIKFQKYVDSKLSAERSMDDEKERLL